MFHPDIDKLIELRSNATPGVWGPTTAPPIGDRENRGKGGYYFNQSGKRGEPTWGAVVSDADPRPNQQDHSRYAVGAEFEDYPYYESGTDIYGGTLVGESLREGNGEYIAALHNKLPGLTQTIRNLRSMLLGLGLNPVLIDTTIADSMKGQDPS